MKPGADSRHGFESPCLSAQFKSDALLAGDLQSSAAFQRRLAAVSTRLFNRLKAAAAVHLGRLRVSRLLTAIRGRP